jgi:hypothetical protein
MLRDTEVEFAIIALLPHEILQGFNAEFALIDTDAKALARDALESRAAIYGEHRVTSLAVVTFAKCIAGIATLDHIPDPEWINKRASSSAAALCDAIDSIARIACNGTQLYVYQLMSEFEIRGRFSCTAWANVEFAAHLLGCAIPRDFLDRCPKWRRAYESSMHV